MFSIRTDICKLYCLQSSLHRYQRANTQALFISFSSDLTFTWQITLIPFPEKKNHSFSLSDYSTSWPCSLVSNLIGEICFKCSAQNWKNPSIVQCIPFQLYWTNYAVSEYYGDNDTSHMVVL